MISLDEDMVGIDNATVIVSGLKVCLGVVCKTNQNWLGGAHFTPSTSLANMDALLAKLNQQLTAKGGVAWMTIVTKLQHWTNVPSGLNSADAIGRYMQRSLSFNDTVQYVDLVNAPASYDVECKNGFTPALAWRPTPVPNPVTRKDTADVFMLQRTIDPVAAKQGQRVDVTLVSPCDGTIPRAVHSLPSNVGGFTAIAGPLINTIRMPVIGTRG